MYRCEAASVEGFVQQLAVGYVTHGYWFYVTGEIPDDKEPRDVDRKLIEKYDIDISKWQRVRRKKEGLANVHYIRFDRQFVLIATRGRHKFFEEERDFKDIRQESIAFAGYSIGYKRGIDGKFHASVRIHPHEYRWLKSYLIDVASKGDADQVERTLSQVRFQPYAPVRRQLATILRAANRHRLDKGLDEIPGNCIQIRRRVVRPFHQAPVEVVSPD